MKIVSCFLGRSEIEPLVRAGADELYTSVPGLPSFTQAGISSRAEFRKAVGEIHALGKKALVAVNYPGVSRNREGMRVLVDQVFRTEDEGADAFIISSPSLLSLLRSGPRRLKAGIHLSSVQPCFNSAALRFFLRFGVERLILPNQLAPLEAAEILRLCRRKGIGTEIFDYRFFGCVYVNGRCDLHFPRFHTFKKGVRGAALCRCEGGAAPVSVAPLAVEPRRVREIPALARRLSGRLGGGGAPRLYTPAAFYDFFRLGAGWLKYGTRLDPLPEKERKIRAMKEMIRLAADLSGKRGAEAGRAEFIKIMTGAGRR